MFDILLYPVSAILWFWHHIFGGLFSPDAGAAWVLAILFLVFTVRLLLIRPALSAVRAGRRTQELAPQLQKIRERHGTDRQRMAREMHKLHSDAGGKPLGGCLPTLIQLPVFFALYWVLRHFTPTAETNGVFDHAGVESFLNADLFGARLGNWIAQPAADLAAFGTDRPHMIAVGLPLMLIASLATFLSMRANLRRQPATNPSTATLSKAMMYLAPAGMLVSGWFFPVPIGVLLYFLGTNVWNGAQQHILGNRVDREQDAKAAAKPKPAAPRPGQRPTRRPR